MKKHNLIFAIVTALALITVGCNVLFTPPAAPQGPQPGQPPQGPNPGQPSGPQPGSPQPGGPQPGGPGPAPAEPILIDKMVTISGNGGSAEVTFDISNGGRVQIMLSASNPSLQPYGSLQYPDGMSVDSPPLNATANGMNQVDVLLTDPGRYTLTLFDGSNQGGQVSVKIIILK